jgi:CheY-like chemotaxis protein
LVEQILAYSRSQRSKHVPVDLARVVAEALDLVRGALATDVRLEARVQPGPLPVMGDATQLHQVAMNLCVNALQAMGSGGTLTVSLADAHLAEERECQHGSLAPGSHVVLTIEDTGAGMDEATLERIFEPFFTTKDAGKGIGLGLALVFGIVRSCGGAIDVRSELGRGSAFTLHFPRVDAPVESDAREKTPPRGRGERVVLVENEETILAVTCEVLARLGYAPCTFSDSRAALAELEAHAGEFDALITDEAMPGLAGTELAEQVQRRWTDLPVLLMSGFVGPTMAERAAAAGVTEILKKPVRSRDLAAALARALGR